MTRRGAAKAWATRFHTATVSRSFRADTKRHCSAIGEAARIASTDAYGATRPIHVIELSTFVYAYRFFPELAVELAARGVRAITCEGYDVVVVSDGKTMPKHKRTDVSLLEQCDGYASAANATTRQKTPDGAAAPQPAARVDAASDATGDDAAPDLGRCGAHPTDDGACFPEIIQGLDARLRNTYREKYRRFDDPQGLFAELETGKRGVFLMAAAFDADPVVSSLAIAYNTVVTSTDADLGALAHQVRVFDKWIDVQRVRPVVLGLPVRSEMSFVLELADLIAGGHTRRP